MAQTLSLTTEQLPAAASSLRAGDRVLLSGTIYTARDAAHKRIFALLDLGLRAMIGKGQRSQAVVDAMVRNGGVYFAAVGGAGALIAKCIKTVEVIAFEDLGCESVKRMTVQDLPLTVAIDAQGGNLYETGRAAYAR